MSTPLLIHLTPPGRGAVASLRVEGTGALQVVARHFVSISGRPLAEFPPGRIVVGRFDPGSEEIVVTRHSDSVVELHCHGGLAAVDAIEGILSGDGCRRLSWQDWVSRQEADPFAAAARLALAEARTARTAAVLLDQYQGALRRAVDQIESSLQAGAKEAARRQIETLMSHAAVGLHLIHPWQVVVAGQPNVGKSSLINAILGYNRAIVHSSPGTTRDIVAARTAMEGWPVEISDTAGLRESSEPIERTGIDLAREKMQSADLVVLVFDRSLPWSRQDQDLIETYPAALRLHNKCDLPRAPGERPPGIEMTATQSTGIEALCRDIAGRLVPNPPPPGAAVPFEPEQIEAIRRLDARLS
jgi:tRNA modification GTPase